ncbi:flavin reductase family protein [Arsenicibacter rosenii]|uniref:Flavin reductase n=1 Tax=Arsenicibacter rosenii TaxID=1750698 RepID=A0A1S2VJJ9_9BACT|nr:flavin reductase family protein [Arsenicibacter rosenii]OIN58932.1 flavin reductase [Arsenicibacter rosenii]
MARKLLKYKNYDVHAITTVTGAGTPDARYNANIATWVMQTAMGGTHLTVALYKIDYTITLVQQSGILNVNLLADDQTGLIGRLGRKSGRDQDKFSRLPYALDTRGCPFLTDAIGYAQCQVIGQIDSGDHVLFVCEVIGQVVLNPDKTVLTNNFLREKGLVRG